MSIVSQSTYIDINPDRLAALSLCRAANALEQAATDPRTWFFIILDLNRGVIAALIAALSALSFEDAFDNKLRAQCKAFFENNAHGHPGRRLALRRLAQGVKEEAPKGLYRCTRAYPARSS